MYDSAEPVYPVSPPGAGAWLMCYVDGYANYVQGKQDFPEANIIGITTTGIPGWQVIDCEPGCVWPPADAAAWARAEVDAGRLPTVYHSLGYYQDVVDALAAYGLSFGSVVQAFGADYDNIAEVPPGYVALQFATGPNYGPYAYDTSVVLPSANFVQPFLPPPPPPAPRLGDSTMFIRNDGAAFKVGTVNVPEGAVAICDSHGAAMFDANHWTSVENAYSAAKAPLPLVNDAVLFAQFAAISFKLLGS